VSSCRAFSLWKLHPQCGGVACKMSDENPGAGSENKPYNANNYDAETLSGLVRVKQPAHAVKGVIGAYEDRMRRGYSD
jgi:hypothetical protein